MKRQTVILIVALVFVGAVSTTAFAQKGGRSGRSNGGRKSTSQKSFKGNHGGWNKGHSFHSNKGNGNKGWNHGNGSGRSNGVNHQKWNQQKQQNFKWNGSSFHKSHQGKTQTHQGHAGHSHKVKSHKHHGHFHHGHVYKGHFHGKYYRAQHHFAVRSKLHFVSFYQFPYDVCWHGGKYWVCFEGEWMPYSYLIQNHAGAWNWHQTYYKRHNHVAFKSGWKSGKKVHLSFKR